MYSPSGELIDAVPNLTRLTLLQNKSRNIRGLENEIPLINVATQTKKGYMPARMISAFDINRLKKEIFAIEQLDNAIKSIDTTKKGITISVFDDKKNIRYIFENCTSSKKVLGLAKADFVIMSKSKSLCFISHKAGVGSQGYQQFVSVTGQGNDVINTNSCLQETLAKFARVHDDIVKGKKRFKKTLNLNNPAERELAIFSIYGPDVSKDFGPNHVHIIGFGNPILEEASPSEKPEGMGQVYKLSFSNDMEISTDLEKFKQPKFKPVILVRYQSTRKFFSNGKEYKDARILICPESIAGSAKEI